MQTATSLYLSPIGGIPTVKRTVRFSAEFSNITPCKLLSLPARGCTFDKWSITRHRTDPLVNWTVGDLPSDCIDAIEGLIEWRDTPTGPIPTGRFETIRRIPFYTAEGLPCDSIDMFHAGEIIELTTAEMVQATNDLPGIVAASERKIFQLMGVV